jgi:hypothetical protein
MFELTPLALALLNWGTAPVIATRTVAADARTVHALLSNPASQACLVAGVHPLLRPHVRPRKTSNPRFLHTHVQLGHRNMLWMTAMSSVRASSSRVAAPARASLTRRSSGGPADAVRADAGPWVIETTRVRVSSASIRRAWCAATFATA